MNTTHQFQHRGKTLTLIRRPRQGGYDKVWSYRLTVPCPHGGRGKRVLRSTGTSSLAEAKEIAGTAWDSIFVKGEEIEAKATQRFATVGEIIDAYLAGPTLLRDPRKPGNNLRRILRGVHGLDNEAVDKLPSTVINRELVEAWQSLRLDSDQPDYAGLHQVGYGANSAIKVARQLFADRARHRRYDHLRLPEDGILGFRKAPLLKQHVPRFKPISNIAEIDAAAANLREEDEDLWLAYALARYCGLRRGEIAAVRGEWVVETDKGAVLEIIRRPGVYLPKGHEGSVLLPAALGEVIRRRGPGLSVYPDVTDRDLPGRRLSEWLRPFLPERQKTCHELRKQAGSEVAAKFNSCEVAARFLREDLQTALHHYLELVKPVGLEVEVVGL